MTKTLRVEHGSLALNLPYGIFVTGTSKLNESSDEYFSMIQRRYPWISDNSVTVLRKRAEREMQRAIEESLYGSRRSKMLSDAGKDAEAIHYLESYLEENQEDADAWYALGELLCGSGKTDEGYKAMNRGRRASTRTDR